MTEETIEGVATHEEEQQEETLTAEQIAELKSKADVSSQNFERAKKAEADKKTLADKIAQLENQLASADDVFADPNDAVLTQLAELNAKFSALEEEKQLGLVLQKYPVIADKRAEFDTYRMEYPASKLETVAKLFLAENDLLTETPKRKGLEKAGGGQRVAPSTGKMTSEDVKRLRENNYPEYMKRIKAGTLQISDK